LISRDQGVFGIWINVSPSLSDSPQHKAFLGFGLMSPQVLATVRNTIAKQQSKHQSSHLFFFLFSEIPEPDLSEGDDDDDGDDDDNDDDNDGDRAKNVKGSLSGVDFFFSF